jgi:hypothetical protein
MYSTTNTLRGCPSPPKKNKKINFKFSSLKFWVGELET